MNRQAIPHGSDVVRPGVREKERPVELVVGGSSYDSENKKNKMSKEKKRYVFFFSLAI